MRLSAALAISCALGLPTVTSAELLSAKLVAYKDCHQDARSLDSTTKPYQCGPFDQTLTYMVVGKNIAGFDKASFALSRLEVDGNDLRLNRKRNPTYKMGPTPKFDETGNHALFNVSLKHLPFGSVALASLDGSIDVITSERLIVEDRKELNLQSEFSTSIGPLLVSNSRQVKEESSVQLSPSLQKKRDKRAKERAEKYLQIYVSGELDAFVGLEVYENGREIKRRTMSLSSDERVLTYPKPAGSIIDIRVKHWEGLKRVNVTFTK